MGYMHYVCASSGWFRYPAPLVVEPALLRQLHQLLQHFHRTVLPLPHPYGKPTADTTRGSLVAEFEGNIKSKWSSSHPCVRHLKVGSLFTVIGAENMHVERNRK